mgnify:CR=1 FL=1
MADSALLGVGGNLVAEDGKRLADAVAAATVYYKNWWQANNAGVWEEKRSGRWYYDGTKSWRAYHNCNQGYAIGASITVTSCTCYGNYSNPLAEWDYYRVKIGPVSKSYNMHVNLYASGSIYYHFQDEQ